ncbi:MAG: hypothetical protein C5B59_00695 [Bacteroidetes bacterium]|nr:MAG: hypothetical protein C5B59_00695 [Bacteroidota bacterium]
MNGGRCREICNSPKKGAKGHWRHKSFFIRQFRLLTDLFFLNPFATERTSVFIWEQMFFVLLCERLRLPADAAFS